MPAVVLNWHSISSNYIALLSTVTWYGNWQFCFLTDSNSKVKRRRAISLTNHLLYSNASWIDVLKTAWKKIWHLLGGAVKNLEIINPFLMRCHSCDQRLPGAPRCCPSVVWWLLYCCEGRTQMLPLAPWLTLEGAEDTQGLKTHALWKRFRRKNLQCTSAFDWSLWGCEIRGSESFGISRFNFDSRDAR